MHIFIMASSVRGRRVAPPQGGGGLPSWILANAPNPGDFYSIPGTGQNSIEPSPVPAGATGPSSKIVAWTSYSIDTRDSKCYSAANGGHNDYAGNEVDCFSAETESPAWSVRRAPTASVSVNENNHYADGRPDSRHSYYGQTVDETGDRLMTWGGGKWATVGSLHTKVDSFRLADNDWNAADTHPDVPNAISNSGVVFAYGVCVGSGGDVYLFGNFNIHRWNRASNTMTSRLTGVACYGNDTAVAYDSSRGRFLVLGGQNADSQTYTIGSNAVADVTRTGAQAANVLGSENGMVYVPAIDAYLLRKAGSGGTVYRIDASTFDCTLFSTSGGTGIPATTNGPYNKFLYAPNLKGCLYFPSYTGNVWYLRVHA